jgi:lactoylglutathione lyase
MMHLRHFTTFLLPPKTDRMKGLAFAYDPDGYWVEIVKRRCDAGTIPNYFNFSQTMLRVKDVTKSISFYEALGMEVVLERNFDDFSLYFMASSANNNLNLSSMNDNEKMEALGRQFGPVLELTHNHGTENDDDFKYYNGNEEDRQGFGHTGFLVDDVYAACDSIREMGYGFKKVRVYKAAAVLLL